MRPIVEVAVNVPLLRLFHYRVPEGLSETLELGHRVLVPFGGRLATGICVSFPASSEVTTLKPVRELLHPDLRFDAHLLELTRWMADYYRAPWGEVLEAALPPPIRAGRKEAIETRVSAGGESGAMLAEGERLAARAPARSRLLVFLAGNRGPHRRPELLRAAASSPEALRWAVREGWALEESGPRPAGREDNLSGISALASRSPAELHPDQSSALEAIREAATAGSFAVMLLHGVTGSGKTEVYLRAFRQVLESGRRGLVLVPEISLTPQIVLRFRTGLGSRCVAVLHSRLTPSERAREWRDIQNGKADLVIGARSAVFAPIPGLGLIVVDEEHDSSYKQESSPRYNGRDVAIMRARMLGIPVVLGSATPSLESFRNASAGKYRLLQMPRRVTAQDLPTVTTVPLDQSFYRLDGSGLISDELDRLIRLRLRRKEQILLFLNRRGFSTYLHCTNCGFTLKCPSCDITLTFHRSRDAVRCHYCDHAAEVPSPCPECLKLPLRRSGVGTEKIMTELARRYPEARMARLDRDTATSQLAMIETLGRFARGEQDILVGTQMVAKGHDFPDVTLVGIVNADTGLHFPDFRSSERTFQVITQVAGRAGRGEKAGRVVIQTFSPSHPAVSCAALGDYAGFVRAEMEFRRALGYPPFGRIVKVLLQGPVEEEAGAEAAAVGALLREHASGLKVLGPAPSPIARIQGKFRFQMLLKSPSAAALHSLIEVLEKMRPARGKVERVIDVDPQSML